MEALDRRIADSAERIRTLDNFRKRTRQDLDALAELTKLIPPPDSLNSLVLSRRDVQLSGFSTQAEELLKKLDSSPLFEKSEFTSQISREGDNARFRVRTQRKRTEIGGAN